METPITDASNQTLQPDGESLLEQLKNIESHIQDFERERERIHKEIIAPYEQTRKEMERQYGMTTVEELRDQVFILFFNIHNNLPEYKKTDPVSTKQLLQEIEFRGQALCKMLEQLRIEETLEELKRQRDKISTDLANLSRQSKFGFYPKGPRE